MRVGDRSEKIGGSYQASGEIRLVLRYSVQIDNICCCSERIISSFSNRRQTGDKALSLDYSMIDTDELLGMRTAVTAELKSRAKAELDAIEVRKSQLLILIDGEPIIPPVDELAQRRTRAAGVAKYRNPANPDQTWTGRGKTPTWITGDKADYLIAA